ncbi:DUF6265 family protein [Moheibacter sediminis]|uniref:DUF6265 domain-containing protein n=1 Tax=Moheibacter sediminis TaxID=1434700 RepID=A0A1W1Z5G7_9FLAO|nr:DUF6265 family protein [Moheibacter sediminis]SMC43361.1 hypothetical protein SAMN06296427_102200 [Moheibacter sediminis]
MKKLVIISIFFIFISCNSKEKKKTEAQDETTLKANFDFLIGEWFRTNDEEGKATFESWKKSNDSTYLGHGFTIKGKDTIWQERVVLSPVKGEWYFQVKSPNDSISTDFKLTGYTDISFVCENQQNEFPKLIQYRKNGNDKLHAEISADTTKIDFEFQKK